ncbi:hypothetical protein [Streptomyces doebereineriae]|uniref:Lipoprotein n=1 Tax=Streptomyces doebereineriae TaxID=3075528 RepID=A0ABU2VFW1_9ACTN|nr:hypothetical protein [Streptomyces sp. DSM 41640]MDT0484442.1 hypothetical protein [Streptomyces sp. DSM 41640]
MESTRIAGPTGAPLTDAEQEQAAYALASLARSENDPEGCALWLPQEQVNAARPIFELGWAMGVRTGHTGPAMAGVPIAREAVARAFRQLSEREASLQYGAPVLWQKVDYHGSVTVRHGAFWVCAIHVNARPFSSIPEMRYDLCETRGSALAPVVTNVRRRSVTPLPEYRFTD